MAGKKTRKRAACILDGQARHDLREKKKSGEAIFLKDGELARLGSLLYRKINKNQFRL